MRMLAAGVVAIVVGVAVGIAGQDVRRDGRWEVKMEMMMPNMPMAMPPTTVTQCVTKEDAADPQKAMAPQGRGAPANDCKVSDYKQVGNKVTYNVSCTSPQPMKMAAEFVYGVDKYDGTMTMEMSRGGQPMQMTTKYAAKRLGDCVAGK